MLAKCWQNADFSMENFSLENDHLVDWFEVKILKVKSGHREGGQGGTMTPGPMDFRKAVGHSGPSRGPMSSRGAHRNDTEKSHVRREHFFFFEITSEFGQNCEIVFLCFGIHRIGNPSNLSWARAYVRLSAPLSET